MEANDFIKYCHTLLQIISIPMDISTLHSEQNIMILHNLQLEGFMDLSVRENGIMFSFGAGDKNVYLIKNTDKHLFDPSRTDRLERGRKNSGKNRHSVK